MFSTAAFALLAPGLAHARAAKPAYLRGPLIDGRQEQVLLIPASSLIFGRGTGSEVRLSAPRPAKAPPSYDPNTYISRRQFQLELGSSAATIVDLGSSNETKLGGKALSPKQPQELVSGTAIDVAGVLGLELEVLHAGKRPVAIILGQPKGDLRVAMVSGPVGIQAKARQILSAAERADLRLEPDSGSLSLSSRKAALDLGHRVLDPGESLRLDRATSWQVGELKFELGLVDAWDALARWMAPYDITHTFCGTPEY